MNLVFEFYKFFSCITQSLQYITVENIIRALLNPDLARRLTTKEALSHTWLTSFVVPAEDDLCGLLKNFDRRACWRNAIGTTRALSCFAKSNGANNNKKDQMALSTNDEDDNGNRGCGAP